MTPLEQTRLPWLQHRPIEDERQDALLEEIVLPSLRAMRERADDDDLLAVRSPCFEGTMLSVICAAVGTEGPDARVRVNLHAHPHAIAAMAHPPMAHPRPAADRAMIDVVAWVLERTMASPRVRHDPIGPADLERVVLAGLRLVETAVLPNRDRTVALCAAGPLGMGGVHVAADDGLRIDRSPDLVRPGPVEISLIDVRPGPGDRRSIVVNIGSTVATMRCRPMDPVHRLRLETMHPQAPDTIHEDGRIPPVTT